MSERGSLCEALKYVPVQWRADFVRFTEDGEASDQFLAFLEQSADVRRACEMVLDADFKTTRLLQRAFGVGRSKPAAAGSRCAIDQQ